MSKLTLKIIESFNFPKQNWTPDWDDSGYTFTLPSGISVSGLYRCNNSPCKMEALEGMDGYVYISTKEELEEYAKLTHEETLAKIKVANPEFKIEDYEN